MGNEPGTPDLWKVALGSAGLTCLGLLLLSHPLMNRAVDFTLKTLMRDRVSLIAGGGLFNPGQFLKILALGADAVYIGTVALFALAHTQVLKHRGCRPPGLFVKLSLHSCQRPDKTGG